MGSPLGMFVTTYYEENYVRDKLPTCDDYYNLYHPSDCIAYRAEPLIRSHRYELIDQELDNLHRSSFTSGNSRQLRLQKNQSQKLLD